MCVGKRNKKKQDVHKKIFLADDHSRVILDRTHSEPNTDYINANYIDVSLQKFCMIEIRQFFQRLGSIL